MLLFWYTFANSKIHAVATNNTGATLQKPRSFNYHDGSTVMGCELIEETVETLPRFNSTRCKRDLLFTIRKSTKGEHYRESLFSRNDCPFYGKSIAV